MNPQVNEMMTTPVITASPDMTVPDAFALMQAHGIRRLPVLDRDRLVGIVTDRDLKAALPSPATSLSIWEVTSLLARLKVREVMSTSVLTVRPDTALRDAAGTLITHKISGLPVVNARHEVVGVLSVTDVLRAFVGLPPLQAVAS